MSIFLHILYKKMFVSQFTQELSRFSSAKMHGQSCVFLVYFAVTSWAQHLKADRGVHHICLIDTPYSSRYPSVILVVNLVMCTLRLDCTKSWIYKEKRLMNLTKPLVSYTTKTFVNSCIRIKRKHHNFREKTSWWLCQEHNPILLHADLYLS